MKKLVLKLDLHDDKKKQNAMKTVSGLSGVESIAMDMSEKKLTETGDIDPVKIVRKLRRLCHTEILTVGPAQEPKKQEPKKLDPQSQEPNKDSDSDKQQQSQQRNQQQPKAQAQNQAQPQAQTQAQCLPSPMQHYNHPANYTPPPPPLPPLHSHYHPPHYYYPPPSSPMSPYYNSHYRSVEEVPNYCAIC